jgi:glutamate racemase
MINNDVVQHCVIKMVIFKKNPPIINQKTNNQPIGIFDSGVGGLSIAKSIQQFLPHENIVYIADSAYAPYGEKPEEIIRERVDYIADNLLKHHVKAIVIACNTATVNAIQHLRSRLDVPIIGVEPAIKPAALITNTKKIAVLVTQATARNDRLSELIDLHAQGVEVLIQPCPGLVELIEQGKINSEQCDILLKRYIEPLIVAGIDTLILGCTHYPFLIDKITAIINNKTNALSDPLSKNAQKKIVIMQTAIPVTSQLTRQLIEHGICADNQQQANYQFFSSNHSPNDHLNQEVLFSQLWQKSITLNNI